MTLVGCKSCARLYFYNLGLFRPIDAKGHNLSGLLLVKC